jgi:hypothetical protein
VRVGVCLLAVSLSMVMAGCGGRSRSAHVSLTVTPSRALADAPVALKAQGLAPARAKTQLWPRILAFLDDQAR